MNASTKLFLATASEYAGRLICLGSLIWFGLIVADYVHSAQRGGQRVDAITGGGADRVATTSESDPFVSLMPQAGHWSFAGSSMTIQKSVLTDGQVATRFADRKFIASAFSDHDATDLVALAEVNEAERTIVGSTAIWVLEKPAVRLRLVTSLTEPPMLVGAMVATKHGNEWEAIDLQPKGEASADCHLLPMPADAKTQCARTTEDGELVMQLVQTSRTSADVLDNWKQSGWDVRQTAWGSNDSFSFLCVKGDDLIYAWSPGDAESRTIMLTRTTASDRGLIK